MIPPAMKIGQMTGRMQRRIDRVVAYGSRRLRREQEAHGLVLMYHRIARVETDPWDLCVRPEHFESQIGMLCEQVDLVPLTELRSQLRKGRESRPVVAITFDDGYVDNLTVAKPVLDRFDAPATVFIATGQIGRRSEFWWDRLAKLVLPERALPSDLELGTANERFRASRRATRGRRHSRAAGAPAIARSALGVVRQPARFGTRCGRDRGRAVGRRSSRAGSRLMADVTRSAA